jgi:hypothetical protein
MKWILPVVIGVLILITGVILMWRCTKKFKKDHIDKSESERDIEENPHFPRSRWAPRPNSHKESDSHLSTPGRSKVNVHQNIHKITLNYPWRHLYYYSNCLKSGLIYLVTCVFIKKYIKFYYLPRGYYYSAIVHKSI